MMITFHVLIKGRVTNVGFRKFVLDLANKLHIVGWVKNKGVSVECVVTGEEKELDEFVRECKKGPFQSEVTEVNAKLVKLQYFSDFRIIKDPFFMQKIKVYLLVFLALCLILFALWKKDPVVVNGISDLYSRVKAVNPLSERYSYISGTGSMYPTFPKGEGKTFLERTNEIVAGHKVTPYPGGVVIFDKRYFGTSLNRGDIVFFKNQKTKEIILKESSGSADINVGFVKRLIALPDDKIQLRDGFVYLNGKLLNEPYIASARSTYGGEFLRDCNEIIVPKGKIFVMGDNRKGSDDSRFDVGFVEISDVTSVISLENQKDLKSHYRDTSHDFETANKSLLKPGEYIDLINKKREEAGVKPLVYEEKLTESAQKRAGVILKYDDLSFEATKSGYTMKNAMAEVGYKTVLWSEVPVLGYFDAQELFDNHWQFPSWKQFLLDPKFQEVGIASEIGELNGCPSQVVVAHFAGYVPPNYTSEMIKSWESVYDNLNKIIPGWEKAKENPDVNKDKLNKLLSLMNERKNYAEKIVTRMKANEWLTDDENKIVENDPNVYKQIDVLAKEINGK